MADVLLWVSLLVSVSYLLPAGATEPDLKLELASIVFRHGDRSPINTFPTDPYGSASDWPQGFGQLSQEGMRQHYHLGQLFKARYVNGTSDEFIFSNYSKAQIHIRSTDVDRTLMSAESQLSALFPPGPDQTFHAELPWQPIPIHTTPFGTDKILRPTDICPAYDAIIADTTADLYKQINEENKDFFQWISDKTGLVPFNMTILWQVSDTLYIQNVTEGKTNPSWVNDTVLMKLANLSDIGMTVMFNSKDKNRLTAGPWLEKVLGDMKNKANPDGNQTLEDMKIFFYSAHDTTVAAMQSALQVFDKIQPGYASAFLVELYSDSSSSNKKYFVKMFRRYGPYSDVFVPLNASYCVQGTTCTLDEFEKFVTPLIPEDIEIACSTVTPAPGVSTTSRPITATPNDETKHYHTLKIIVIALGCCLSVSLLVSIILIVVALSCARRNKGAERVMAALQDDNSALIS